MSTTATRTTFDYNTLDEQTSLFVLERAYSVFASLMAVSHTLFALGYDLNEVLSDIGEKQFKSWVRTECNISYATATRYIRISKRLGNRPSLHELPITVIQELAALSTPDWLIDAVERGDLPGTYMAIREAKHLMRMRGLESIFPGIGRMPTPLSAYLPGENDPVLE